MFQKPDLQLKEKILGVESFDHESGIRHYTHPSKEITYPSATSILQILDDGGLDKWRKRVGHEEAKRITEDASKRGNDLHDAYEQYLLKDDFDVKKLDPRIGILFNRGKKFLNRFSEIYAVEYPLFSDHLKTAGTVDIIGILNGKLTVLDFKSARYLAKNAKWGKKKIFKYLIQCGLYGVMWYEHYGQMPQQAAIIMSSEMDCDCQFVVEPIKPFMREGAKLSKAFQGEYPLEQLAYYKVFEND